MEIGLICTLLEEAVVLAMVTVLPHQGNRYEAKDMLLLDQSVLCKMADRVHLIEMTGLPEVENQLRIARQEQVNRRHPSVVNSKMVMLYCQLEPRE